MAVTSELARLKRRSDISRATIAGADTEFIRNCWYVAATSEMIGEALTARTLLGRSVLLFRTSTGQPVALQNRCGHRSFPLSEGRREGDTLVCGYHGLRYATDGRCVALSGKPLPGGLSIARYPVREIPPLVWIWMGTASEAQAPEPPHPAWLESPDWTSAVRYVRVGGSYVHLHENLLDLSHLSFLHAASFGTPEYADAPIEVAITPDSIDVWRTVRCTLPAIYADPLGWKGAPAIRRSGSSFVSPGLHVNTGEFRNEALAAQPDPLPTVKVAQFLTPETADSTHYHFAVARNFARNDDAVSAAVMHGFQSVFAEDVFAVEQLTALQRQAQASGDFSEFDIPTDRPGLEMRRRLKRMADAERETSPV
jgi:vanillate O-demethylase monooxygenase subunit